MRLPLTCVAGAMVALLPKIAAADCADPGHAPAEVKGATATTEEMTSAHNAVQAFVNSLQAYQACLEKQIHDAPPDTDVAMRQAWRAQGNAAVDLAHDVAADYAEQYKIFKSRH